MQNEYCTTYPCFSSAGIAPSAVPCEGRRMMEDRIYTCEEMRTLGIDTSEYRFLDEIGDFRGELVLKAEARNNNLRAFFDAVLRRPAIREGGIFSGIGARRRDAPLTRHERAQHAQAQMKHFI